MSKSHPPLEHILGWTALALGVTALVTFGAWTELAPAPAEAPAEAPLDPLAEAIAADLQRAWALLGANSTVAQLSADVERLERASQLIDGVLERWPDSAEAYRLRGVLAIARGELETARAALERCLELDPDRLPALLALGAVHAQREDQVAAEAVFRRAVEIHPRSTAALHNLGQTLWMLDRRDEAMDVYRRKVEVQQGLLVEDLATAQGRAGAGEPRPPGTP